MAGFANTSLSVVGILTYQNEALGVATASPLPQVIGISYDTLQKWLEPCEYIDQKLVTIVGSINSKKQEIVNICQTAASGNPTLCSLSTTASGVSAVYASVSNGTIAVGIGTTTGGSVGLASTGIVGYGTVYADTLVSLTYPNLENGNYSTDNPIENGTNTAVTSGNAGIGKENTFTQNNGSLIGNVFAITDNTGTCGGYATSITNLIQEIADLRTGITSYLNASNSVKGYKHAQQLDYWSLNKSVNISNQIISSNNSLLEVLNNPSYGGPY
jgi:hypothetical protein